MTKLFFLSFLIPIIGFSQPTKFKIYPFKSAIIEYKYEASFSGSHITYIDDYGYKQADYYQQKINGEIAKNEIIILIGEKAYTIDLEDSTIAVGRNVTYGYYLHHRDKKEVDVTEAILKKSFGYYINERQPYLDKECKVWKNDKSTVYTWQGLVLKSEINFMMMMVEKATKIKVDKKLPKHIFEIPEGFTYISSDVYQGMGGLEPLFEKEVDSLKSKEEAIHISFNTASMGSTSDFEYFTQSGEPILLKGINDFNKIDNVVIKSQVYAMAADPIELPLYIPLVFKTTKGLYGKLQVYKLNENQYDVRYMLFDADGMVADYASHTNASLAADFNIAIKNNQLKISPKGKAKCLVLGG